MFLRSFVLRFFQMVFAVVSVYLLLLAGTFYLQHDSGTALALALFAAGLGCGILILHVLIRMFDSELTLEVGRLLYPSGIIASLIGAVYFSLHTMKAFPDEGRVHLVYVLAAALLILFFIIRMFDLKWLRSLKEVNFPRPSRT